MLWPLPKETYTIQSRDVVSLARPPLVGGFSAFPVAGVELLSRKTDHSESYSAYRMMVKLSLDMYFFKYTQTFVCYPTFKVK